MLKFMQNRVFNVFPRKAPVTNYLYLMIGTHSVDGPFSSLFDGLAYDINGKLMEGVYDTAWHAQNTCSDGRDDMTHFRLTDGSSLYNSTSTGASMRIKALRITRA